MSINRLIRALVVSTVLLIASLVTFAQTAQLRLSSNLNRGIELYHQGKFVEASNLLKKVVKQTKRDVSMFFQLEHNFDLY